MSRPDPVRVLIVEDHALVREGTAAVLQGFSGIQVVGAADSADGAVKAVYECAPHVVLLDFRIPGGGLEAARRIAHVAPGARILVVSAYGQSDYVSSMSRAGVAGYLLKSATPDTLVTAIRAVASGGTFFDESLDRPSRATATAGRPEFESLTMRELDVLQHVARGVLNREIADALEVSTKTVEAHLSSIYAKLGVRSRTEAVVTAARAGIIDVELSADAM